MTASKVVLIDEKAWSTSGDLYLPSTTGQRRGNGINIQAEFKNPGFYSIQFGILIPPAVLSTVIGVAEIQWAVKGNTIRRVINVYNGTVISGGGESVGLRLQDVSENNSSLTPVKYTGIINMIPGTRANMANGQPPIYTPRDILVTTTAPAGSAPPYILTPGELLDIPIPKNAGVNSVMMLVARDFDGATKPALINNQCVQITHVNSASGSRFNVLNYDSTNEFVPLAPGATDVRVENTDVAGANIIVTPIFGVEG